MEEPLHGVSRRLLRVVRRSLSHIDRRLVDHGERVAFIADRIANMSDTLFPNRDMLPVLCLLHDIGAYKTEEINRMAVFETMDVIAHAAYGYAFLRNTTPLGASAEAVLYHHMPYERLRGVASALRETAALINLADRVDILLATRGANSLDELDRLSGSVFSPALVRSFFQAEKAEQVSEQVISGAYQRVMNARMDAVYLSRSDIQSYLNMLVYSIDFRSPYTVTHTANTVDISLLLADLLGVTSEERECIRVGAFLHDFGKIATPYSILEHPGRLTDEQMRVMRGHASASNDILMDIMPDDVRLIAVRHHEKLNGSGYPEGLTAEALTLPQRIVAVADILSALINRRSYKEPFSKETALSVLKKMRDNGEICPRVCRVLFDHYDELIAAVNRSQNPVIELYERIQHDAVAARRMLLALEESPHA